MFHRERPRQKNFLNRSSSRNVMCSMHHPNIAPPLNGIPRVMIISLPSRNTDRSLDSRLSRGLSFPLTYASSEAYIVYILFKNSSNKLIRDVVSVFRFFLCCYTPQKKCAPVRVKNTTKPNV
ncbi:hypothetical protein CLIB1423_01S12882 [[Candida] railenensis]|uniref:Uncharacterized protein n=1 Tax=[Candida] railenensis TaxID=45579 RepID=A0A9P0VW67_9ASCO|nr:hypothetical protein CLIB1423_01S12882 [[Candida] railenensis]